MERGQFSSTVSVDGLNLVTVCVHDDGESLYTISVTQKQKQNENPTSFIDKHKIHSLCSNNKILPPSQKRLRFPQNNNLQPMHFCQKKLLFCHYTCINPSKYRIDTINSIFALKLSHEVLNPGHVSL